MRIYMQCPICDTTKKERIIQLRETITDWIYAEPLQQLIELYNGKIPENYSFSEYIDWLKQFAERWDYRKKQLFENTVKDTLVHRTNTAHSSYATAVTASFQTVRL